MIRREVGALIGGRLALLFLCGTALLTACGPGASPATATRVIITLAPDATRARTLPPTWTPTDTATPAPTRTPTLPSTPVPTRAAAELCSAFRVISAPPEGAAFEFGADAQFVWQNVPPSAGVRITVTLEGSANNAGFSLEIPADGDGVFTFSLLRLPEAGRYLWRLWVQHPTLGTICEAGGHFVRKPSPDF